MFVGHYAPALLARWLVPETRLGTLFLAAQALDFAFDSLVLLGVERMHLLPDGRGPLAMSLDWMPYSHSLVSAGAVFAAAVGVGASLGRLREGVALGAVAASHWALDVVVHRPDVHLGLGDEPRLGFGLWEWPWLGLALELVPFVLGARLVAPLVARERRWWRLVGVMVVLQLLVTFARPVGPPELSLVAAVVGYVLFAVSARAADRSQEVR